MPDSWKESIQFIKSMRPETWFLGSVPIIFTCLMATQFQFNVKIFFGISELIIIIVILLLGGTNMFNEVFDVEADKINKPRRPIASGKLDRKSALVASLMLMISGVLWSYFVDLDVFLLAIIALVFGILYSSPKVRFKDVPLTTMLTLGVGYGIIIPLSGWFLFGSWQNVTGWLIISMSFPWFFGASNSKDFKDVPGDRINGTKTLPILIGEKKTIIFMLVLMSIIPSTLSVFYFLVGFFPIGTLLALLSFLLTGAVFLWLFRHYSPENALKCYKITYFLYPSIFLLLAIGFLV
jgi:geranylgeranylglycerol-phosphate geranylgeranyltransferase